MQVRIVITLATLAAALAPAATAAAVPCADTRSGAIVIPTNGTYTTPCSNAASTKDNTDPMLRQEQTGTVWFKWTAPASGPAVVDIEPVTFDAILGVFQGDTTNPINGSGVIDMIDERAAEHVNFSATAGQPYYFMVAGYTAGETGDVAIRVLQAPPENDVLAGARTVQLDAAGSGAEGMNNYLATQDGEAGEPRHAGYAPHHTLWFQLTAPRSGRMFAQTCWQHSGDTVVAVYTGDTMASLTPVAANDDSAAACGPGPDQFASHTGFSVIAGTTYLIAVGVAVADGQPVVKDGAELLRVGYDESAPTVAIASGPTPQTDSRDAAFDWSYTGADVERVECSLDGAVFTPCADLRRQTYAGLAPGDHLFRVRTVDASGNLGTAAEYAWTITAPAAQPPAGPPATPPASLPAVIASGMKPSFAVGRRGTLIRRLVVPGVAGGSTVVVRCVGRGCAFKKRTIAVTAAQDVALQRLFKKRRLRPGASISVTVTRPGTMGRVERFRVRKGRKPSRTVLCLPPAGTARAC